MPEAAAEAMLNPFLPVLAQEIASILCYGGPDPEGGLNVVGAITPKVALSRGGASLHLPTSPHISHLSPKVQFSGGDSVSVQFSGLQGLPRAPPAARDHPEITPRCSRDAAEITRDGTPPRPDQRPAARARGRAVAV